MNNDQAIREALKEHNQEATKARCLATFCKAALGFGVLKRDEGKGPEERLLLIEQRFFGKHHFLLFKTAGQLAVRLLKRLEMGPFLASAAEERMLRLAARRLRPALYAWAFEAK